MIATDLDSLIEETEVNHFDRRDQSILDNFYVGGGSGEDFLNIDIPSSMAITEILSDLRETVSKNPRTAEAYCIDEYANINIIPPINLMEVYLV